MTFFRSRSQNNYTKTKKNDNDIPLQSFTYDFLKRFQSSTFFACPPTPPTVTRSRRVTASRSLPKAASKASKDVRSTVTSEEFLVGWGPTTERTWDPYGIHMGRWDVFFSLTWKKNIYKSTICIEVRMPGVMDLMGFDSWWHSFIFRGLSIHLSWVLLVMSSQKGPFRDVHPTLLSSSPIHWKVLFSK